jgi:hypothetical protein
MITGSWRIILYPYLIVIGISVLFGMLKSVKSNPRRIWVPLSVSIIYLILYGWLDIMTIDIPTGGSNLIFGLTPSMALYLLGIWPFAVLVCLLYAWTNSLEKPLKHEHNFQTDAKG